MMTSALPIFFERFKALPVTSWRTPFGGIRDYGILVAQVIYRENQFQVELVTLLPGQNKVLTVHRHPNMDSIDVVLHGRMMIVTGDTLEEAETRLMSAKPVRPAVGTTVTVLHTDWHGAMTDKFGASFLSVQHWLNGVPPTAAGIDWEGAAIPNP